MKTITLNIKNSSDYQILLQLAKRLNISLSEISGDVIEKPEVEMVEALKKLALLGGIKSIRDPAGWQRKIRKDGKLTFEII